MVLVIGGAFSGKRAYVQSLGYANADMADAALDSRPVLYNLQDLVAQDPAGCMALVDALLQKEVVVCNEVGSGVIPGERRERLVREQTGRLCNRLAQSATRVVRVVCGVPVVIKG